MISSLWSNYRYLIARRVVQISIMLLYMAGNYLGWSFLQGNLSSSFLLGIIPLNDPFAVLQMFSAGAILTTNIVVGALIVVFFYSLIGGRVFCLDTALLWLLSLLDLICYEVEQNVIHLLFVVLPHLL